MEEVSQKDEKRLHFLTIKIVTPGGTIYNRNDIKMAVMNTMTGELGVMANHVPLVVALKISQMRIYREAKVDLYAINGGFAEFRNNLLTIVADSAENANDINLSRALNAKKRAETREKNAATAKERDRARIALTRAINRIKTSKA